VRAALPDELRAYMDGLGKDARTERIRLKRNVSADRGWAAMVSAAESALAHTGRVDEAGMAVAALRMFLIAFIFRKSRDKSFGFHDDCFAS